MGKLFEHEDLLEEQIAYYRARAGEYDEWFLRQGCHDRGPEWNRRWFSEVEAARARLGEFHPSGEVLELACGTGFWTAELVRYADRMTAVDASPEVLKINREKVARRKVRYVQADLFDWQPDGRYDVVFFSFWLSHVPPERFEPFWNLVRRALAPGGRVFFVDSLRPETSRNTGHGDTTTFRKLNDGREFQIYKVFYQPDALLARMVELCWNFSVETTGEYLLCGCGSPTPPGNPAP